MLRKIKFPTENLVEVYLNLPQEWRLMAPKIWRNFISSIWKRSDTSSDTSS